MIQATPETINSVLSDTAGGFTIELSGVFPRLLLRNKYALPIRIIAERALVKGLTVTGAGIDWLGGQVDAFGGSYGKGPDGYGIRLYAGCSNVSFQSVKVRNSDRGFVLDRANQVKMAGCDVSVRQDGMIISGGEDLDIIGNRFHEFDAQPTTCWLPDGTTERGLARRDCEAKLGAWQDGDHSDAIQLRNGIKRALIAYNSIENIAQGIGQMESPGDAPLDSIALVGNQVEVSGFHSITILNATNVSAIRNRTKQLTGRRSPLRVPADAILIENDIQSP
jgi:hypothetical protein